MRKQTHLYPGWPEGEDIFSKWKIFIFSIICLCFGWTVILNIQCSELLFERISLLQKLHILCLIKQCVVYSIYCAVYSWSVSVVHVCRLELTAWLNRSWIGSFRPGIEMCEEVNIPHPPSRSLSSLIYQSGSITLSYFHSLFDTHVRTLQWVCFGVRLWIWMTCFRCNRKRTELNERIHCRLVTREMHHCAIHVYLYIYSPYTSAHLMRSILYFVLFCLIYYIGRILVRTHWPAKAKCSNYRERETASGISDRLLSDLISVFIRFLWT